MERQRNIFQRKKQDKTSEKDPSEIEISNLPDKEFKVMVIKMLTKTREEWMNFLKHTCISINTLNLLACLPEDTAYFLKVIFSQIVSM